MRERDRQQKFLVESCDVRGHLVQLDDTWTDAVARTEYPEPVKSILGEAFVAATLLSSTVKFDGKVTLQVRGNGPIHLLVVQVTNEGTVRGLARWDDVPVAADLSTAFGADARMIISIEARAYAEPYQGIVPLEGDNIADALQTYFSTSEQLPTRLYLAVSDNTAAGVLIQKLPIEERTYHDADGWQRASVLCETLTKQELCHDDSQTLLHRIFHEEKVRLFDAEGIRFHCSCSRERTDGMLLGLGDKEVESIIKEQGKVEIICEFCDADYNYDSVDVAALFKGVPSAVQQGTDDNHEAKDVTKH
ncbi:MAG: Hsp33 family molecular chaperone HslO [Granulosicoccus sp.]